LKQNGIDIISNPFGTIYNTHSIYKQIERLFNEQYYTEADLIYKEGLYFTLDHASKFDSIKKEKCLQVINHKINTVIHRLKNTDVFIITPGTSVVYLLDDKIMANCHKLPHNLYQKKILTVDENRQNLKNTIKTIKSHLNKAKIILTLSPIRHTPTNLQENSYSKAILRAAIEELIDNQTVFYFPSYEIVIDELRSYAFYKHDGIHLKPNTINYIIKKFSDSYFSADLNDYIGKYQKINKMLRHKVRNPTTNEHLDFLISAIKKIKSLEQIKENSLTTRLKISCANQLINYFYSREKIEEYLKTLFDDSGTIFNFYNNCQKLKNDQLNFDAFKDMEVKNKILRKYKNRVLIDYLATNNLI
jgi:hypothetical protein